MSVWLALVFVLVATVAAAVVVAAFGLHRARRSDHRGLRRVRQVMTVARVVAVVLAVRVVLDVVEVGSFGQGLALAPGVAATVWVVAGVVAEAVSATMLRDGGANLEVRTVGRYLPQWGTALLAVAVLALAVTGVLTSALADASGRGLTYSCGPGCTGTRTPWPGPFYLLPIGVVLALLLVLTALRIVLAVRRPRGALGHAETLEDDRLRRGGAASALAVAAVAVTLTATGLLLFGMLPSALDPHTPGAVTVAVATVVLAMVLSGVAAVALLRVALGAAPAERADRARSSLVAGA